MIVGLLVGLVVPICAQFEWQTPDAFDEIRQKVDQVHAENCKIVDINDLFLDADTVTHVPDIKWLGIDPVFPNRTNLLHVHNMALYRSFFYSYILQKAPDDAEPGFMYYFLSSVSDVAANTYINASSVYYGPHLAFTPSYKGFYNKTMPLFAPRAYRADDFNDPYQLSGASTLNTIVASDLGAVPPDSASANYTHEQYKVNEWYNAWLPDHTKRQDSKTTYTVTIAYANGTNETFVWHGPPAASDVPGPVKWTRPYFDCERSNKWSVAASVPVADIFPRHTGWRHIEIPLYVAVTVLELDFERLDINQCPLGGGNPAPNRFANTARCKRATTECEPVHGYGFRRGGYQCRCRAGFRLPNVAPYPYMGEQLEKATTNQFNAGFDCAKVGRQAVRTQNVQRLSDYDRAREIGRISAATGVPADNRTDRMRVEPSVFLSEIASIHGGNCEQIRRISPDRLRLRGDAAYGQEQQFENQARMALRLAHFVSAYLQTVRPDEKFAEFRVPDRQLSEQQLIGEVLSMVIGDQQLLGGGIWFERGQFTDGRPLFAPYAIRRSRDSRHMHVIDLARGAAGGAGPPLSESYLSDELYRRLKTRWSASLDQLETFTAKIDVRYNSSGLYPIRYDYFPLQYRAAALQHGQWSAPFFDCNGLHGTWLTRYAAPFFGFDSIRSRLEFKGVVVVSMQFADLSFDQCEAPPFEQNAFANTHKCDRRNSRCVPVLGRKFETPAYKCECKQGFEYPYNDDFTFYDGQILEAEYSKLLTDQPSRFDTLKCRISTANKQIFCPTLLIVTILIMTIARLR